MMEWFFSILCLLILLLLVVGAVYFFYRAIRLFIIRKIWRGIIRLILALLLGFIVFSVIQTIYYAREKALQCTCSCQLKQIVLSIKEYANDNQEAYPSQFDELATKYLKEGEAAMLIHPTSHHRAGCLTNAHEWTDYAYVSGLSEADPSGCVVAFCLPENHKGEGANVAFINGSIMWFSTKADKDSPRKYPTFQELTNTPSLFYGTTNLTKLVELMSRTKVIYPKKHE